MNKNRAGDISIKAPVKPISKQEKRDLQTLEDDFGLLHRKDTRKIIENCKSYAEVQRAIMRIYMSVYMSVYM